MCRNRADQYKKDKSDDCSEDGPWVPGYEAGSQQDQPDPQRSGLRGGVEAGVEIGEAEDAQGSERGESGSHEEENGAGDYHCFSPEIRYLANEMVATNVIREREIATSM